MEDHYQVGELPNSFFNHNWDEDSIDQSLNFESALSSMVSSPVASNSSINPTDHSSSIGMRELIGRLGSICNSDEISHQKSQTLKTSSCYTTPLNSPPKLNLSIMDHSITTHQPLAPFSSNPGFTERAARFSSFGTRSFNGLSTQFGSNEHEFPYRSSTRAETGNLSRVSSTQSLKNAGSQMRSLSVSEFNNTHEDSSISEQIPVKENGLKGIKNDENARKRKTVQRGKAKETDSNSKRSKSSDDSGNEKDSVKNSKDNQKPSEPPKDYIHVRARRGEATDSHSLAERVRREKFSEKMKFLQDLIPGCNKITGKAVVLDEIINYVQSLQRQVEFLSMKLATFNPRLDSNMETLLSKDILQSRGPFPNSNYPLGSSASTFPYGQLPHQQGLNLQNGIANGVEKHCSMNPLDSAAFRRNLSLELPPFDGFLESASQLTSFWEDDLQSVVQMGFNQNQEHGLSSTHMKVEP